MKLALLKVPCSAADEDVFGPVVDASCRNGFDFTLLFEELILALLPIAIFFLAASVRIWVLRRASEKVNRSWLYAAKEVRFLALTDINSQLIEFCLDFHSTTRSSPTGYVDSLDPAVYAQDEGYRTSSSCYAFHFPLGRLSVTS